MSTTLINVYLKIIEGWLVVEDVAWGESFEQYASRLDRQPHGRGEKHPG